MPAWPNGSSGIFYPGLLELYDSGVSLLNPIAWQRTNPSMPSSDCLCSFVLNLRSLVSDLFSLRSENFSWSSLGSGQRYMSHTFLHVARVKKYTDMRELHAFCVQFSHVRVFSDSRHVQKRATKSDAVEGAGEL